MEDGFEAKKVQTVSLPFDWKIFSPKKISDETLKENTQKRFNNSSLVRPMWYIVRVLNESLSWKEFSSELWNDFNFLSDQVSNKIICVCV